MLGAYTGMNDAAEVSSGTDKDEKNAAIKKENYASNRAVLQECVLEDNIRMQQFSQMTMAKAAAMQTTEQTHTTKIYDIESLFQVFESWVHSMKTNPHMGIPIGFNWSTVDLEFEFNDNVTGGKFMENEATIANNSLN